MAEITLDTTPAAPKPPPRRAPPHDEHRTTSLSYDQVNSNADELVELRGEGRYFGVTDGLGDAINAQQSLGPLCANCHKRGHIRAKCKTVVCHKCGVVGDHYETQCPTTMICLRCGLKGHIATNCTNKVKKREYCRACDTFSHGDDRCPNIWRLYLTITIPEDTVLPLMYCYNCGDDMHYGDECPEMRSSRVPNPTGSAFSGSNLPRHLREIYHKRLRQASYPASQGYARQPQALRTPSQALRAPPRAPSHAPLRAPHAAGAPRAPARGTARDFSRKPAPRDAKPLRLGVLRKGAPSPFNSPRDSKVQAPTRLGLLARKRGPNY